MTIQIAKNVTIHPLSTYFKQDPIETKLGKISQTPVSVLMLSKEKKLQLRSIALGLAHQELKNSEGLED